MDMLAKMEQTHTCPITGKPLAEPASKRKWEDVVAEIPKGPRTGPQWYVVHCAGTLDKNLIHCAETEGWEVFVPKCMELKVVPKRQLAPSQRNNPFPVRKPTAVPMFPRYPFLRFDFSDPRRYEMFKLFGVQGMIFGADAALQPAYIEDAVIQRWKGVSVKETLPLGTTVKNLQVMLGEQVKIASGPFWGFPATVDEVPDMPIEKLDHTARLRLLVNLFGQMTPVELSLAEIEKL